jgi:hypothetical protein
LEAVVTAKRDKAAALMRVLCPIVEAVANLVPIGCADVVLRSRIGPKRVGDDQPRAAVPPRSPLLGNNSGRVMP